MFFDKVELTDADKMYNAMRLFAEVSSMNAENALRKEDGRGTLYGESDYWKVISKYN